MSTLREAFNGLASLGFDPEIFLGWVLDCRNAPYASTPEVLIREYFEELSEIEPEALLKAKTPEGLEIYEHDDGPSHLGRIWVRASIQTRERHDGGIKGHVEIPWRHAVRSGLVGPPRPATAL